MALSAIGRNAIEGEGRCRKAAPQRRSSDPGPKRHSELTQHGGKRYGAGEGNRTLTASLGSSCSTIELRPPAAAILASGTAARQWSRWWGGRPLRPGAVAVPQCRGRGQRSVVERQVILSDRSLREAIEAGRLIVDPIDDEAIQPSSIDIRLDSRFRVFHNARYPYIDVRQSMDGLTELVEVKPDDAFILHPGEFVLGSTLEMIGIPADLAARLEGKSSLGRLGLLTTPADRPYGSGGVRSKYQGQRGPTPSRYWENFRD